MKHILLFLLITIFSSENVFSQCLNKNISTDPRNPFNSEKPNSTNGFFWFPHNGNNNSQINMRVSGTNPLDIIMNNPFWQGSAADNNFEMLALYGNSDFYPEDGWELIKSDFGYLADNSNLRSTLPVMTYFCLYNRHTGIMRFLGAHRDANEAFQIVKFKVEILQHKRNTFNPNKSNINLEATNLLSIQGDNIDALDKPTEELSIEVLTDFPGSSPTGYFFWFDIPVAYDPCICYNNVAIQLSGEYIKTGDLTMQGKFLGVIQSVSNPTTPNYNELIFKKVVAAGFSLGTAIATKGAVIQAGPFIDLISVIANKPGTSTQDKKNWEMFQKFLTASNNLLRKDGKWIDAVTNDTLNDADVAKLLGSVNNFVSTTMDLNNKGGGTNITSIISGDINLSGTLTTTTSINNSPYWAVPGSALSLQCEEEVTVAPNSTLKNPEYPIYNEALGTFALLKTPKLKLNISRITEFVDDKFYLAPDPFNPAVDKKVYIGIDGLKIQGYLPEDLFFALNPKQNLNFNKTKISAMVVMELGEGMENWDLELMDENKIPLEVKNGMNLNAISEKNPINMEYMPFTKTIMSIPVDINNFRELFFQARIIPKDTISFILPTTYSSEHDIAPEFLPKVYLKLYFEFESFDIGRDGKPVKSVQLIRLPYESERFDGSFPMEKHNILTREIINLNRFGGQHYNSSQIIYAETINITTNISVAPGSTLIIRAKKEINVLPGVEIGPGVILEVKSIPFSSLFPQTPKNGTYLANYCTGNTTDAVYRANQWAKNESIDAEGDSEYPSEETLKTNENNFTIYPNPSQNKINIDWFSKNSYPKSIQIFSATGQQCLKENFTDTIYDITFLAQGVYFVEITFNDGSKKVQRFIKLN